MDPRQNNSQLELFSESGNTSAAGSQEKNRSFFSYIRGYEKTVLLIIGFIVISIISFSLGIEKGKSLVTKNANGNTRPTTQSGVATIKIKPQATPPVMAKNQNYVIQLGSYKNKSAIQQEAEILRKQGLYPLVLNKGSYFVLFVGNLSSREAAQSLLPKLKKRYKDCYIRRF